MGEDQLAVAGLRMTVFNSGQSPLQPRSTASPPWMW